MNHQYLFEDSLRQSLTVHEDQGVLLDVLEGMAAASLEIWNNLALNNRQDSDDTQNLNNFGELTKAIDIQAVRIITENTRESNNSLWLVTEEDTSIRYPKDCDYALFVDPIDGSKHVRYQSECGTFFSLVCMTGANYGLPLTSGYALYGYLLSLVIAIGGRLVITVYDPKNNRFVLTDDTYKMPPQGKIYSINDADINDFSQSDRDFVESLRKQHFTCRYNGVLVADLHRLVMEGGIFISPCLKSGKTKAKKYFEAIAIGHIMQASGGGSAYEYTVGQHLGTAAQQKELFSSVPLVFGSKAELENYRETQQ